MMHPFEALLVLLPVLNLHCLQIFTTHLFHQHLSSFL